jgi:aminoglycoside phosphotransferase (APT) family kinase protein
MTGSAAAATSTPAAEVVIDAALVRALLGDQHPDLAHLPITLAASGWDNMMFRLGDRLSVRLPRRLPASFLMLIEQRWLPQLASRLPLPIPAPLRIGGPGQGYPWMWSVLPWLEGTTADRDPPGAGQGEVLARFFTALHTPAPVEAPRNDYRGGPLADREPRARAQLARLADRGNLVTPELLAIWETALATPIDVADTWIHGDPHARNVLVEDGALSAFIDWGDMAQGDRANDLSTIWMLLSDCREREAAMAAYAASDATWARARGWAVMFAVMLLDIGDDERMHAMGERTIRNLLAGP